MYDFLFKIIILGDTAVGKSTLCSRYVESKYNKDYEMTIGVEFMSKLLVINNHNIKLEIWDTAGQEKFRSIIYSYYRNSAGAIICFDITNRKSFESVEYWIKEIKNVSDAKIVIVGTKSDLEKDREVNKEDIDNFVKIYNLDYYEVSSMNNTSIKEVFTHLACMIYTKILDNPKVVHNKYNITGIKKYSDNLLTLNEKPKEKHCCKIL